MQKYTEEEILEQLENQKKDLQKSSSQADAQSEAEDESNIDLKRVNLENFQLGRWTSQEHATFVEGLSLYGKNWKNVADHIGTRSALQIRSHAQKFFNRLEREYGKQFNGLKSADIQKMFQSQSYHRVKLTPEAKEKKKRLFRKESLPCNMSEFGDYDKESHEALNLKFKPEEQVGRRLDEGQTEKARNQQILEQILSHYIERETKILELMRQSTPSADIRISKQQQLLQEQDQALLKLNELVNFYKQNQPHDQNPEKAIQLLQQTLNSQLGINQSYFTQEIHQKQLQTRHSSQYDNLSNIPVVPEDEEEDEIPEFPLRKSRKGSSYFSESKDKQLLIQQFEQLLPQFKDKDNEQKQTQQQQFQ